MYSIENGHLTKFRNAILYTILCHAQYWKRGLRCQYGVCVCRVVVLVFHIPWGVFHEVFRVRSEALAFGVRYSVEGVQLWKDAQDWKSILFWYWSNGMHRIDLLDIGIIVLRHVQYWKLGLFRYWFRKKMNIILAWGMFSMRNA